MRRKITRDKILGRLAELAWGRVNDVVRLLYAQEADIEGLDLTMLSEIKQGANGLEIKLVDRRGALPMIPELGSRLYLLGREKAGQRSAAVQEYVAEALSEETEIQLADVVLSYPETGEILVQVYFDYKGQRLLAQVEV